MTAGPTTLLVMRAQTGDLRALDRLLGELQGPLYRHIRFVVGDDTFAHDVLQDTLLIIARRLGSLREPEWIRAWSYRIANREAIRAARKARRYSYEIERIVDEPPHESDDEPPELGTVVLALVDTLPAAAQVVIRLHYVDGLSNPEIAEALEIPLGTVRSRLAYGLRLLRERAATTSHAY